MTLALLVSRSRTFTHRALRFAGRAAAVALGVVASVVLCLWLTLYWGILPRLEGWRPQIEAYASHALGLPVRIGGIVVASPGWVPTFELLDVVLRDARGHEALRLPHLRAALSLPPLLAGRLRFDGLRVDSLRLEVRRDAQGRIHVAGMDIAAADAGSAIDGAAVADWFFDQAEFAIEHGSVRWVDEQRNAAPLHLDDVRLVVRNGRGRHDFRLDATPPPDWGDRFTVIARARSPIFGRPGDFQRWKGTLYAELPRVDAGQLHAHVDLPFRLDEGRGALRTWIDWDQATPQAATLDVALSDVSLRLQAGLQPLQLARLSTRLSAVRDDKGVEVKAAGLAFTLGDGRAWPASDVALGWRQANTPPVASSSASAAVAAPVTGGHLQAQRLDLALLAELAERLPLGSGVRRLLAELDPKGQVQALEASWDGALDAPTRYRARARVSAMAIAAAPAPDGKGFGRPGWRAAEVEFDARETGGEARLHVGDGAIELPGVFEQALVPIRQLDAGLAWTFTPAAGSRPRIDLRISDMRFENADGRGTLSASWHTGGADGFGRGLRLPGVLELSGSLGDGRATSVARYLPLGIPASVRDWVRDAVRAGEVADVGFRVSGDLADFPFVDKRDGDFRIGGRVIDATLAPIPAGAGAADANWPAFGQINGELVFERGSMRFSGVRAHLWGTEVTDVTGTIAELGWRSVLEIDGTTHGPAADLLRYAAETPIGEWLGGALAQASVNGAADLRLGLKLPITHLADSTVRGTVQLGGGDFRLRRALPALAAARGRLDFSQNGFQIVGASARLAGGDVAIEGGSQPDGSIKLALAGNTSADALARLPELAPQTRWLQRLRGQTGWRLEWAQARGAAAQWQLTSTLAGLAIDLPPPLGKREDTAMPLRVSSTPQTGTARDSIRIELGARPGGLGIALLRDTATDPPRVVAASYALGAALPEPSAAGQAVIDLPQLDVDAWRTLLQAQPTPAIEAGPALLPRTIMLRAGDLVVGGRHLNHVDAQITQLAGGAAYGAVGWQAQLTSDQASGVLIYREPRPGAAAGRLFARLKHLAIAPTADDEVESMLDRADGTLPALDVEVEEFELRGRRLGTLVVEALNEAAAGNDRGRGRWRLDKLELRVPEGHLAASGQWVAPPGSGRRRVAMDFRLEVGDAGNLLERLGFGRLLRGGKGQLDGRVSWQGSPSRLDIASLEGAMTLQLDAGQFVKVDPGAGRLLGVLSLQSLPRRLTLDFRDLFGEGFAFDNASGDVELGQGAARTNNLRLRGVQAAVLMEGSADLMRETQDLHVVVVPEINAGTASLAYAAINPAVGLGTFLGQLLLRAPLREAGTREFRITGTWDDPQIARVARTAVSSSAVGEATAPAARPAATPAERAASAP